MCPTQKMMEERDCAGTCVFLPHHFRHAVLWGAGIVVVFANLAWIMRALEVVFIATGALVIGAAIGYLTLRRHAAVRRQSMLPAGQRMFGTEIHHFHVPQQLPPQQQALPPVQNTLSIPHTWTPEEAAEFIRLTRGG